MIKEEYKDLPDTEFVPLKEGIDSSFWGKYMINKKGEIKTVKSGKIRKITTSCKEGRYPTIILSNQSINKKIKSYYIHRLVAFTFLKKEDESYNYVDHINRNILDCSVTNLRWCDCKINSSNQVRKTSFDRYFSEYDLNWNYIRDISYQEFELSERRKISKHVYRKTPYNGKYYKFGLTGETKRYLDRLNIPHDSIRSFNFVKIPSINDDNILISKEGILKVGNSYTPGSLNNCGYYIYSYEKTQTIFSVHRLVYEAFSKEVLTKSDVIDHVSTVTTDNRFENLLKTDTKGNMNNPLTVQKRKKTIEQYDLSGNFIKSFKGAVEAATELTGSKVGRESVLRCCRGGRFTWKGYIWIFEGDSEMLASKLKGLETSICIQPQLKHLGFIS